MTDLEKLQTAALHLSHKNDLLREELMLLESELAAEKAAHMLSIRSLSRDVIKRQTELAEGIKAHPELFTKPRTYIVEGVKFGMRKQVGKMEWPDDLQLVGRIDALFAKAEITPAQYEQTVETRYAVLAKGLEKLDAKTLKRLGVTVEADTDAVEIKSVDSDVERMLKAIIKDALKDVANEAEFNATAAAQPERA